MKYSKVNQTKKKTRTHKVCSGCEKRRLIKFYSKPTARKCNTCKAKSRRVKRQSSTNRKKIVRELDNIIREILKKEDEVCCCCGKKNLGWFHPKDNPYGLQVGHYVSRKVYALRWDLRNVAPQCSGCNYQHNNDPVPYTRYMLDKYGKEVLDELTFKRKAVNKHSTGQLKELLEELKGVYEND